MDNTENLRKTARTVINASFEGGFCLAGATFLAIDAAHKSGLLPHPEHGPAASLAAAALMLGAAAWRPCDLAKSTSAAARVLAARMVGSSLCSMSMFGLCVLIPTEWPLWARAPLIVAAVAGGVVVGVTAWERIESRPPT